MATFNNPSVIDPKSRSDNAHPVERAVLVRQQTPAQDPAVAMQELSSLVISAGAEVCGFVLSQRRTPSPATFIGKGKIEEIKATIANHDVSIVVFDHAISPIQERNLERALDCRVLDRTGLILDIFAQRASTSAGKLQVELAQLRYLSTRLVRGWTHLERQKGGIGLRGPGETQLETDRRLIGGRIKSLKRKLEQVEAQRKLHRRARQRVPIPTVSLVGYTNAGKSSLFNRLTHAKVYVANRLFATLDATMRRIELPGYGQAVLSDTVGFIRDLPHTLVSAFHATLEEVTQADLLLHVIDASDPDYDEHMLQVEEVLQEIGAQDVPRIEVFNKIDLLQDPASLVAKQSSENKKLWLSAQSGHGLDNLHTMMAVRLGECRKHKKLTLPVSKGRLRASIFRRCEVHDEAILEDGSCELIVSMDAGDVGWLSGQPDFSDINVIDAHWNH
ncbi:MAG: ribosome rescue GTPase HflX [Arenicellales bacterium WSBS_2016_MAG_OTU3]